MSTHGSIWVNGDPQTQTPTPTPQERGTVRNVFHAQWPAGPFGSNLEPGPFLELWADDTEISILTTDSTKLRLEKDGFYLFTFTLRNFVNGAPISGSVADLAATPIYKIEMHYRHNNSLVIGPVFGAPLFPVINDTDGTFFLNVAPIKIHLWGYQGDTIKPVLDQLVLQNTLGIMLFLCEVDYLGGLPVFQPE